MKKVELAARFVVHWNVKPSLGEAVRYVSTRFPDIYPAADFARWNTIIDIAWANTFFLTYKDEPHIDLLWIIAALSEVR